MTQYVEMRCDLAQAAIGDVALPVGITAQPVGNAAVKDLYACYHAAFEAGEARFFFEQTPRQRREFFDSLGLDEAGDPASLALMHGERVIGFSLVLQRGSLSNRHISCMCIHPDFQGRGLGKRLLWLIMAQVKAHGGKTITLGTEPEMRAYALYRANGFAVIP